jgi:hypothetical protein
MHTSKIREIMALLSPLYHAEMLKNAKVNGELISPFRDNKRFQSPF